MRFQRLLLILSAGVALAQMPPMPPDPSGPPGPPDAARHDELKQTLGLTDDQVKQLVDLRKQERDALRPVFTQMHDKRTALHDAMQAQTSDAATVGALFLELKTLRKQMQDTNLHYRDLALAVLNDAQKTKLKDLEAAAKLAPAIHQGVGLNLLAAPEPPGGMGFGEGWPLGRMRPMGARPGMGTGMGLRRPGR